MKIIDIHSHFFNLKYLPVAGIIVRYSQGKVPHRIANGIEWLLLRYTRSDFETAEAQESVSKRFAEPKAFRLLQHGQVETEMDHIFDLSSAQTATAISQLATPADLLESNPLTQALEAFEKEFGGIQTPVPKAFSGETARMFSLFDRLKRMLEWLMEKAEAMKHYLKWFLFMTNSEDAMYRHLRDRDANPGIPDAKVEHFLHLLMDVDAFFNEPVGGNRYTSYFDFATEQIPNMQKLNQRYSGTITGFVAFNPARENCMEIIEEAVLRKGFKGVKFYPPLGYRADSDPSYAERIDRLLAFCNERRVPLFTHCNNQGFEAHPGDGHSGYNSNPVFWEEALQKHNQLILCLAHGGGVEGWFTANRATDRTDPADILAAEICDKSEDQEADWNCSYAAMVYKLCVKYDHVYCDAAYLDEMVNSDGTFNEQARANFKQRLLGLFADQPRFSKKIMYGSDWHMLFQEAKNQVYLSNYITFFGDAEFDPYRSDFFYENARRFLNL